MSRVLTILSALVLGACSRADGDDPFTLAHNLRTTSRLELAVAAGPAAEALAPAVARLESAGHAGHGLRWRVEIVEPTEEVADEPAARIVVGDADTPGMDELLAELGRRAEAADLTEPLGPELGLRARTEPGFGLLATFADPARPGLPVTIALAHDAFDAARLLGDVTPCAEPSWQLFVDGELSRAGLLWRAPRASPPAVIELDARRAVEQVDARRLERARFELRAPISVPADLAEQSAANWEKALARLDATLLLPDEAARVHPTVFAHWTIDAQMSFGGRAELSVANPIRPVLHALVTAGVPDDEGAGLVSLTAREALGAARAPWLARAIGIEAASTWYGQSLGRWLAHLARAELVPPIATLIDPHAELSPLALEPARAGLVRFLFGELGRDGLRALWRGERALEPTEELEAKFRSWLAVVRKAHDAALTEWRQKRGVVVRNRGFRHGIAMVAPSFDPRVRAAGFGSAGYLISLGTAKAYGADSTSLVFPVYAEAGLPSQAGAASMALGFASSGLGAAPGNGGSAPSNVGAAPGNGGSAPSNVGFAPSNVGFAPGNIGSAPSNGGSAWGGLAAGASDLELFVATLRAKELRLNVMLRPCLYASPTSSLAGWSLIVTPGGWEAFFAAQERVGVHYGLLSELAGAELFCFAGEISNASVTKATKYNTWERAELPGRARQWQNVIERTRAAYTGGLLFAAETLYEAEAIQFWGLLDFIGIDVMPEVVLDGLGDEFSRERVVKTLQGLLFSCAEVAEIHARPLIVTEFGFSSTADGWKLAAMPRGEYDGDMQSRLYEAWCDALVRTPVAKRPTGGAYLWSWSTDPHGGGDGERGYSPQAKPAARNLSGVFRRP
ncbi:MAG: hypothetical protein HZA52_02795 [Planctomycetes bacterium]|nr:hypothetical protein [Planctomycetota bacterium]